jgi:hypothetical protein
MSSHQPGPGGNQRPCKIIPSPSAASHPTNESTLPCNRTTPRRNVKPLFRISTTYSTIAARAISFQRQLLSDIIPHQLAQNGFYHQVRAGVGDIACRFTCEIMVPLKAIQGNLISDLSKIHKENCFQQVIFHDLKLQPTPTITSPKCQQRTNASVLQQPTRFSPPPRPTPPNPTLTIEELRRRFHNKPSPFEIEERKHKRPKTVAAAQSLSRFLDSALPAFSRFLVEMQPAADNCWPPYMGTHYSRAMGAA